MLLNETVMDMMDAVIVAADEKCIHDLREYLAGAIATTIRDYSRDVKIDLIFF